MLTPRNLEEEGTQVGYYLGWQLSYLRIYMLVRGKMVLVSAGKDKKGSGSGSTLSAIKKCRRRESCWIVKKMPYPLEGRRGLSFPEKDQG